MSQSSKAVHKRWRDSTKGRGWKMAHLAEEVDASKRCRRKYRDAALQKLGNKCANPACQWLNADGSRGCTDFRCLQVDHVVGGGNQERKQGLAGLALYHDVLADQTGKYQALCANCNWIKRHMNHENWFEKDVAEQRQVQQNLKESGTLQ